MSITTELCVENTELQWVLGIDHQANRFVLLILIIEQKPVITIMDSNMKKSYFPFAGVHGGFDWQNTANDR